MTQNYFHQPLIHNPVPEPGQEQRLEMTIPPALQNSPSSQSPALSKNSLNLLSYSLKSFEVSALTFFH